MITVQEALNEQQQKDAFHVRFNVFVNEQKVPEDLEMDELDDTSLHFIAYEDSLAIGAGRLRFVEEYGKAERVCVLSSRRKSGAGRAIMQTMEQKAREKGCPAMKLNAQISASAFYKSLGYTVTSKEFMDAGIPHVEMKKSL
ncbi:GNAT family N-acetyltransferase [Salibacterium aidingense]|uniref:GNAT family N-acetyltransferase n=1 Tax=Salibacterium aidingense TaxID=384933 RepID=UPI000416F0CB|nr:GNAT family N-acetyltransferase [Salibacterium aidingense]